MDHTIIQMNENTWRIEDKGVRFFLLAGTERALLIDSGMTIHNARDIAATLTDLPIVLLNTHADMDHIGSNAQFDSFYMHPAEAANYRRWGGTGEIIPIAEGDTLDLGGRPLRIIHLPGHTPGSVAVLDVQNRTLISGDPIQEHGRIFMFGSHRDMHAYIDSLAHLEEYGGEFDELWPSHADLPIGKEAIGKLREGALAVLAGKVEGRREEMHGHPIVAYDLGLAALLCDV